MGKKVISTEQKRTPQKGDWYEGGDGIHTEWYLCLDTNNKGDTVWRRIRDGVFFNFSSDYYWSKWRHLPGCTGPDWVEPATETWPKYYVHKDGSFLNFAYAIWESVDSHVGVVAKGGVFFPARYKPSVASGWIQDRMWIETTREKALANVVYHRTGNTITPEPKQVEFRVWCIPANLKTGASLIGFTNEVQHMRDQNWREVKVNAGGQFYYEE